MKQSNNDWLKRIVKRHDLSRSCIADNLLVAQSTVDRWMQPDDSTSYRKMPNMARKLLGMILEQKGLST